MGSISLRGFLREGVIQGSQRMIPGERRAVCLFDLPLTELGRLLVARNRHRYQRFGIALDKRYAFAQGSRPVVYLSLAEAKRILPTEELWRVAAIDLKRTPSVDWTFEREWRVLGDLALPRGGAVALVESWRDVEELYDRFDGKPPCAGVMPLDKLFETSPL